MSEHRQDEYQDITFNINGTPIKFKQRTVISNKQEIKNILAALKTNYPALGTVEFPVEAPLAIVGSGPSLRETWQQLKDWPGDIFAMNAAHDFLIDKEIIPDAAIAIEGGTAICQYFEEPHSDVFYLLASSCHPKLYRQLKGHRIAMFHLAMESTMTAFEKWLNPKKALSAEAQAQRSRFIRESAMISGASTVLTRALCVATLIGYRDFHFFGCDSSFFDANQQHNRDPDRYGPGLGTYIKAHHIDLEIENKVYKTSPQLLHQVFSMKQMMTSPFSDNLGLKYKCYGDSLLQQSM